MNNEEPCDEDEYEYLKDLPKRSKKEAALINTSTCDNDAIKIVQAAVNRKLNSRFLSVGYLSHVFATSREVVKNHMRLLTTLMHSPMFGKRNPYAELWLRDSEVCALLVELYGISKRQAREAILAGELASIKIGKIRRIQKSALTSYVLELKNKDRNKNATIFKQP